MAFRKLFDNPLWGNHAPLVLRWSDDAEARRLAAAAQQRTHAKEKALTAAIAEITKTVPLSDEARQRIAELMGGADGWRNISRSKHGKALAPTEKE